MQNLLSYLPVVLIYKLIFHMARIMGKSGLRLKCLK